MACGAIIFDCDGLLLDTEHLYNEATRQVLEKYGVSGNAYSDEVRQHVIGVSELEGAANAVRLMGVPVEPHIFLHERESFLANLFPQCAEMKGARNLVLKVIEAGIPCGLATSANRKAFELKLANHGDWILKIPQVVTGCQLPPGRGKPEPDIFLRVAELIGFKGRESECLVFEDAPSGCRGAKAAGMKVIAVPDPSLPRELYLPYCNEILGNLTEFNPEKYGLPFTN